MNRRFHLSRLSWLALAALVLLISTGPLPAASPAEERAWNGAVGRFNAAKDATMRKLADQRFDDFIKHYPTSEHLGEAIVFRAQIMFEQSAYDDVIDLLKTQAASAGNQADQFAYLTARAYAKKSNYEAAADAYARLVRENTNSPLRLEALYREAEAHGKLLYWPRVIEELGETNGAFQLMAQTNRQSELVVDGLLLLGEAQLAQHSFAAAEKILTGVVTDHLPKELEWERQSLLCRVQLESGHETLALSSISNLLATAVAAGKPDLKAKTFVLEGEIYAGLQKFPEAVQAYQTNLNSDVPLERRQALLNIVELELQQDKLADAAQQLKDFLAKHPEEKGADLNRLLLGELELRQYYRGTNGIPPVEVGTNLLQTAQTDFEALIKVFTNSEYRGKAELNLGWCLLAETNIAGSLTAFSNAVEHLPFSADQAVAQFKLGDLLYQQRDFAGALEHYSAVANKYDSLPVVKNDPLYELALYKVVVTSSEVNNLQSAEDAMGRINTLFPEGQLGERSMLLVGQEQSPVDARATFANFLALYPQSKYFPEVKLAVARSYEREGNWANAVVLYDSWVATYTNHPSLPRAEFSRALCHYKSGDETNAFEMFNSFVERFWNNEIALADDLPARAKFWVGDYFWRAKDFQKAEVNYEEVFEKWTNSDFAFQARMRAGRAAMGRQSPQTAITYFTSLATNSNCPPELAAQALVASGDAYQGLPSGGTDASKSSNYVEAMTVFLYVATKYTNSSIAPLAWGRLGDCYYARAEGDASQYGEASNAFERAMTSKNADVATRSMAEFRLGETLAAMAHHQPSPERKPLLVAAMDHFFNVLHGYNLNTGEQADLSIAADAGLEAAKVAEESEEWTQAIEFYQELKKIVPSLEPALEKKITRAREKIAQKKTE